MSILETGISFWDYCMRIPLYPPPFTPSPSTYQYFFQMIFMADDFFSFFFAILLERKGEVLDGYG